MMTNSESALLEIELITCETSVIIDEQRAFLDDLSYELIKSAGADGTPEPATPP